MEFENLKNLGEIFLKESLKSRGHIQVFLWWDEIVGKQIASVAQPKYFKEGILGVEVKEESWRAELTYHVPILLEKYSKRIAQEKVNCEIKKIRFKYNPFMEKKEKKAITGTIYSKSQFQNEQLEPITLKNTDDRLNAVLQKFQKYASGKSIHSSKKFLSDLSLNKSVDDKHSLDIDQDLSKKTITRPQRSQKIDRYYRKDIYSEFITPPDELQHFDLY